MIRFSCPGCAATYSVDDAKGGKTGRCPKCQAQFVIPMPEEGAAPAAGSAPSLPAVPAPPPPPADPNEPVEIAPCPGCQARLSVAAADLGVDVECPHCKTVYAAVRAGAAPPAPPPAPPRVSDLEAAGGTGRSKRRAVDDEDDDRPSKRRRGRDDDDEDDDRPRSRRRDDDEEDDRPRKKKRRGRSYEPHRGVLILALGILAFVFCGIFTGIPAWIMGKNDLRKMDDGVMDPEGRTLTNVGKILGMINVILTSVVFLIYCVIGIFAVAAGGGR